MPKTVTGIRLTGVVVPVGTLRFHRADRVVLALEIASRNACGRMGQKSYRFMSSRFA